MVVKRLKKFAVQLHWIISSQFGLDARTFVRSMRGLPAYFRDWRAFRKDYSGVMSFKPCLSDRYEEGGVTKSEYFWQDLLVAQKIYAVNPEKHVDVGSRFDGFIAHVASFRALEVFDVRPLTSSIPGVVFKQADLMRQVELAPCDEGYCDSISCLHAIEHFGLGRYGDPITPNGYSRGIANMAKLLKLNGLFYLATPIGRERVEFNANRIFDPREIVWCGLQNGLRLSELLVIGPNGPEENKDTSQARLDELATQEYNLGIFVFQKTANLYSDQTPRTAASRT